MEESNSLTVRKHGIIYKIISKLKILFHKEEKVVTIKDSKETNRKQQFMNDIKVSVNNELVLLKLKLERGEIKAIDLTNEQIEELQKIYDEEILQKRKKIEILKKKLSA